MEQGFLPPYKNESPPSNNAISPTLSETCFLPGSSPLLCLCFPSGSLPIGGIFILSLSRSVSLSLFLSLASSSHLVLLREHNTALFVTLQSFPWQPTHGPSMRACARTVQDKRPLLKPRASRFPPAALAQGGTSTGVKGGDT